MKNSITPLTIKQTNQSLIYQYIYKMGKVSLQDICQNLKLSRPTVTTNLNELLEEERIEKSGLFDSQSAGRKASAYVINPTYRISIGVEILRSKVKMIAIDLYGKKIDRVVHSLPYENSELYYKKVCSRILEFTAALQVKEEQILGVGIAFQALISPDNQSIIYGKILECTGLTVDAFTRYLPYPVSFFHDSDSAAFAELWVSSDLQNAYYLSISRHLGSSVIREGKILTGKHGHNSTAEHIPMVPGGKRCYCGKCGCMDTLLSLKVLTEELEELDSFFDRVRAGDTEHVEKWEHFLDDLARSINLLHLVHDTDFILGGYLAPYLTEEDLHKLYEKIRDLSPFPEDPDYLQISKMPKHNIAIGSALPYIQEFLE